MIIDVSRSLNIRADQYVNVWISSINFWSFLQSHSFSIASWETKDEIINLDFLIDSRKDLTQKLYTCVEYYKERLDEKINRILNEHFKTIIKLLKSRDVLYESIEQSFQSIVVNCHESHERLLKSIKKEIENIQSIKFDYERYEDESQRSDFRLTIISELHDMRISVNDYEKIVMIVIEFDIIAQLSYLKQLIRVLNNY